MPMLLVFRVPLYYYYLLCKSALLAFLHPYEMHLLRLVLRRTPSYTVAIVRAPQLFDLRWRLVGPQSVSEEQVGAPSKCHLVLLD